MDLGLPDIGGAVATEQITAVNPRVRVVVITFYDDEESVRGALEAGASGYVVKDANPDQIIAAIGAAGLGALWLGSGLPPRRGDRPRGLYRLFWAHPAGGWDR